MEKEDNKGKENILNLPSVESDSCNANDDIEVIPSWRSAVSEGIAVTYGPPPTLNEENIEVIFQEIDDEYIGSVNSDMYGGPLPVDFLLDEPELYDFSNDLELLSDDTIDSDDESKDRKYDNWDDTDIYYA